VIEATPIELRGVGLSLSVRVVSLRKVSEASAEF
jgi:hypothetical protein